MSLRGLRILVAALALATGLPATAIEATLTRRVCECGGNEGPRTRAELEKADYRWLDDGRLEVQDWSYETTGHRIDERAPVAEWRDGVLRLEYGMTGIECASGEASMACLFVVRLVYHVSALVRRAYRVHASPASIIDVAP